MPQSAWTVDDSRRLYNLSTWGDGYFDITEQGELAVGGDADHRVALPEIVEQLATAGLRLPVLLRFSVGYARRLTAPAMTLTTRRVTPRSIRSR